MPDKVILITGGSRGIGAATAELAAAEGYRVAISYLAAEPEAAALVNNIQAQGGEALAVQADVGLEADILRLFSAVDNRWGRLDALVNNAGILRQGRVVDASAEYLARLFAVNVTGSFLCAREAVKRMATSRGGHGGGIVNISSIAADHGSPGEYVDYAASKGAIDTFTRGLAKEVAADGIRVNAVRPGLIHTEIHARGGEPGRIERLKSQLPMQRGGYPEEVARAILWLLSEQASYSTGASIDVSGGR